MCEGMMSTEFTFRKIDRKIEKDGFAASVIAASDLLVRKRLGRPIFDTLVEHGVIQPISRPVLKTIASETVTVPIDTDDTFPFVSLLEEGNILSETGLVLTPNFEILEESAAVPDQAQQAMMAMLSRELFYGDAPVRGLLTKSRPRHSDSTSRSLETVAPLIPRYRNYYHWMIETVPQIRYIRAFEQKTGERVTLLIRPDAPSFVDETLELLEWPRSRIKYATEPMYDITNLILPSFPERHAADFEWLRSRTFGQVPETTPKSGNNIYVSRANAVERRVVNEDEVMDVLSQFGFSCYQLEERSLKENVCLFADADIVVGPHGAGLTDIIFANDCTLVELFGDKIKPHYRELTSAVDLSYEPMYCRAESTDIVVDTAALEETVREICDQ